MKILLCLLLLLGDDAAKKATHDMVEHCRKVGEAKCIQELNENPAMHHYKTISTKEDIRAGAIIEKSDLWRRGDFWSSEEMDFATDLQQVVGHVALKPIHAGDAIHLSDVNK